VAQLVALIQGRAEPQAQSVSGTPDPAVIGWPVANGPLAVAGPVVAASGPAGTDIRVRGADADGMRNGRLLVRINRILKNGDGATAPAGAGQPCLSATWRRADGTQVRGIFATARHLPEQATRP
jgi:hypothetical protein